MKIYIFYFSQLCDIQSLISQCQQLPFNHPKLLQRYSKGKSSYFGKLSHHTFVISFPSLALGKTSTLSFVLVSTSGIVCSLLLGGACERGQRMRSKEITKRLSRVKKKYIITATISLIISLPFPLLSRIPFIISSKYCRALSYGTALKLFTSDPRSM